MPLDPLKLTKIRRLSSRMVARCPACSEIGQDQEGNHLVVWPNGAFGCVVYPADKAHRRRIWHLAGDRRIRPLVVYPEETQSHIPLLTEHRSVTRRPPAL